MMFKVKISIDGYHVKYLLVWWINIMYTRRFYSYTRLLQYLLAKNNNLNRGLKTFALITDIYAKVSLISEMQLYDFHHYERITHAPAHYL